ncbi:hypothetical protein E4T49_04992 [Aureobasidium sp. EXF-10728]|nr:hypothetical protein E4T49_04992 [Aureobasidium sp. EXF-10728]
MAPVKRPHDVISIHSDHSEDHWVRFERPHKMARHNEAHLAPNYDLDDWIAQENMQELMHTGPVKDEPDTVPQAEPGAFAADPQYISSSDHDFGPPFEYNFNDLPFSYEQAPDARDDPIVITDTAPTPERSQLDQVLDVVPDVAHDHVTELLNTHYNNLQQVLDILLDAKYPKESERRAAEEAARQAALHDQKVAEDAEKERLLNPDCTFSGKMKDVIIEVLKDEFNTIPVKYIREVQKDKKHLYPTYMALNEAKHTEPCPYGKTPWRPLKDVNFDLLQATRSDKANIPIIKEQFESARKSAIESNSQRRKSIAQKIKDEIKAAERAREEELALEHAKASGTVIECAACYDEYAPNKVVTCGSADKHPVCFDCMRTYLESEIGQSSFRLVCPGGCDGTFCEPQLRLVPNTDLLTDKLMRLRQEHDLRTAGIDDVESCPFCDFKTVCLPVDIDFEFHCQSPTCNITSCRKCKEKTHIPDSCEENQRKRDKDNALSHRHRIEEARSKALIRNCNKCSQPFIKSDGCNKITCSNCGNLQCYLCGVNVTANYAHFHAADSKCILHNGEFTLEARHAQEVKAAAETAQAEVLREHPEIDAEDLAIETFVEAQKSKRDDMLQMMLDAGDVARNRRRRVLPPFQAAGMPGAEQLPVPHNQPPHGGHRAALGPPAHNPNAQQYAPAPLENHDPAFGQFDFGFDAQAGADMPGPGPDYRDAFWPPRFLGGNLTALDFEHLMLGNHVPQPQVNMALPFPGPAPAHGAQNVNNLGDFDAGYW